MKLEDVVKNAAGQLVSRHFVSMNDIGLLLKYSFRTHDVVSCINVEDMLKEQFKLHGSPDNTPEICVNIINFYFRESFEWWCSNVVLCCLPLATCTAFDTLSTLIYGPYYELQIWKKT